MKLTICVPVYNEATAITAVLRDLRGRFAEAQIIVVDDGSTDGTQELLKSVAGIRVIRHQRNRGYGASIKSALRQASGEYFAWFDGDGQHRVEDLDKVVMTLAENDLDACIGMRGKDSDVRWNRIPGKWLLTFVAEWIAGQTIPDLNSGLRCFRSNVLKRYVHLLPDGFSASTTSTMLMIKRQYSVQWVEIIARKRAGRSSVRIIRDGFQGLALLIRIFVLFESFRFFFVLSAVQVIPAGIYGTWRAITYRLGFPTFAAMVMISGILTFLIGIVCDQITALRKERFE
jgi:glycosyltransferase involved in cell wall biosynthesis